MRYIFGFLHGVCGIKIMGANWAAIKYKYTLNGYKTGVFAYEIYFRMGKETLFRGTEAHNSITSHTSDIQATRRTPGRHTYRHNGNQD